MNVNFWLCCCIL